MKFNQRNICRWQVRACSGILAAGLLLGLLAAPAGAVVPSYIKGTWPPVSTQVTTINGWIVVQGLTLGGVQNQVLWRVPIIRAGNMPVSLEHGIATSFVRVGNMQFVVDNATGQTYQLQNGQVWRRWPAGVPEQPPVPPPETPSVLTQLTPPAAPAPPAPAPTGGSVLTPPAMRVVSQPQAALQQLQAATSKLADAIAYQQSAMLTVRTQRALGWATDADVDATDLSTRMVINQARRELKEAQRFVREGSEPTAASVVAMVEPTHEDLSPAQLALVTADQDRAYKLNIRINNELRRIETLKESGASGLEIAQLQQAVDIDQAQLDQVNAGLTQVWADARAQFAARRANGGVITARVVSPVDNVAVARDRVVRMEAELARLRELRASGGATDIQVNNAVAKLADAMQKLSDANRQLLAVPEPTTQPAPEPATQPAPEATTMPATAPAAEPAAEPPPMPMPEPAPIRPDTELP